jgi:hypothetical protein
MMKNKSFKNQGDVLAADDWQSSRVFVLKSDRPMSTA